MSWSHYCKIIRIENAPARDWYANECIANHWSVRALERQIGKLYYERLLASTDRAPVVKEAAEKPMHCKPTSNTTCATRTFWIS